MSAPMKWAEAQAAWRGMLSRLRRAARPRSRGSRGATSLEGAVILIPFLVVFLSIFDFGMTFMVEAAAENAAVVGAQQLASDLKAGDSAATAQSAALTAAAAAMPAFAAGCVNASTSAFDYWALRSNEGSTGGTFVSGQTSYARFRMVCDWTLFSPLASALFGSNGTVTFYPQATVSVQ